MAGKDGIKRGSYSPRHKGQRTAPQRWSPVLVLQAKYKEQVWGAVVVAGLG